MCRRVVFQGAGKGSKRKVDARYAGEGYGLLTQAGCVRMRSRGDSPIGLRVMDWIALRAMSIKSALRECLPAVRVILSRRRRISVRVDIDSD